jgi:hypothetical protein
VVAQSGRVVIKAKCIGEINNGQGGSQLHLQAQCNKACGNQEDTQLPLDRMGVEAVPLGGALRFS